jgi:predicted  nucleic acid-binding Zn-ribbon protein
MKNYLLIASVSILLFSCNPNELSESNRERDSLRMVVNERDSFINDFITSFSDIEYNLNAVSEKQHIIVSNTVKTGELQPTQKERINAEIKSINNLMVDNRKKIADLNELIKRSSGKNVKLEKMITTLNAQISKKDIELTELNSKLNSLNAQVATLETSVGTLMVKNSEQAQSISEKNTALHTVYYVVGKSNDLQDANIIDRKGGLLGIGKTSKLSDDFDNSKFTQIDYTQTSSIPVNSDMKIITTHPVNSYMLEKDEKDKDLVKNIFITNPELFWSASKYLVVVKN